ncbi:MAG TPA: 6-phosphogluconolactonase [Gammaproteobacteria bacterium]|nr:6-phosphogluconolactonase [Gammaproteobacteria bacterium]
MTAIEHRFESREDLLDALYPAVVAELEKSLAEQSSATLLLSGGSTPAPLYRQLAGADLDWANIDVALVDERWVETDDDASNERLLRETLLRERAAKARFTGMKNDAASADAGADACNRDYARLPAPYSLCMLGMGADGHTASLFPNARGLDRALASECHCAAIHAQRSEVTGDNLERMTMTPWAILQARKLILLISGDDKWRVYLQARQNGASAALPVSLFIAQDRVPVEVYWAP